MPAAPVFAAEVRCKNDYGLKAEQVIAQKIADYFAGGAQVVWDVDLQGVDVIKSYRASVPDNPLLFQHGDTADAEPAVPRWASSVDALFR